MKKLSEMTLAEFKNFCDGIELLTLHRVRKSQFNRVAQANTEGMVEFVAALHELGIKFMKTYPTSTSLVDQVFETADNFLKSHSLVRLISKRTKRGAGRPQSASLDFAELILWALVRSDGNKDMTERIYDYLRPNGGHVEWRKSQTMAGAPSYLPTLSNPKMRSKNWKFQLRDQLWRVVYQAEGGVPAKGRARSSEEIEARAKWLKRYSSEAIPPIMH